MDVHSKGFARTPLNTWKGIDLLKVIMVNTSCSPFLSALIPEELG